MTKLMAAAVAFVFAGLLVSLNRPDRAVAEEMTGTWAGTAQIVVNWTVQRTLSVQVTIAPGGGVSGRVGDAALRNAYFAGNRGALGRALTLKTDWIVNGELEGDVIKAEGVRRAGVRIPLNWVDDHFEGGVNTSGSHVGGKESMWLAARDLRLERVKVK